MSTVSPLLHPGVPDWPGIVPLGDEATELFRRSAAWALSIAHGCERDAFLLLRLQLRVHPSARLEKGATEVPAAYRLLLLMKDRPAPVRVWLRDAIQAQGYKKTAAPRRRARA